MANACRIAYGRNYQHRSRGHKRVHTQGWCGPFCVPSPSLGNVHMSIGPFAHRACPFSSPCCRCNPRCSLKRKMRAPKPGLLVVVGGPTRESSCATINFKQGAEGILILLNHGKTLNLRSRSALHRHLTCSSRRRSSPQQDFTGSMEAYMRTQTMHPEMHKYIMAD